MRARLLQIAAFGLVAVGVLLLQARPATGATATWSSNSNIAGISSVSKLMISFAQEGKDASEHAGRTAFFEWLNFAILVGGLFYLLRKPLASYFSSRRVNILKRLEEGRKALEESAARLQSIEQKLERLNDEMTALRAAGKREIEAEAERMRRQAAIEAERISESARAQVEAATRAAIIELKAYAASQATELAGQMVRGRLDRENQGKLVQRFVEGLNGKG